VESKKQKNDDPFAELTALTQNLGTMAAGVDWKEGIDLQIYLDYKEPAATKRAIPELKTFLKLSRRDLVQNSPDVPESPDTPESAREAVNFEAKLYEGLMDQVHLTRTESSVCVHTRAKLTLAEIAKGDALAWRVRSLPRSATCTKIRRCKRIT
jgi:hypothetical protein